MSHAATTQTHCDHTAHVLMMALLLPERALGGYSGATLSLGQATILL